MNLLIFGPQASGKGTQAKNIAEHLKIPHISTGDIFRENISQGTKLGKMAQEIMNAGNLIPNDITNEIIEERLSRDDCDKGFILDGYPRNKNQTEFLDNLPYPITIAFNLMVSKDIVIKRMSSRRVCSECKAGYNILFIKPKKEGICDKCGGELIIREDDTPEAIKKRLEIYHNQTKPLLGFYKTKGVVIDIDGEPSIDEVFEKITEKLNI